MNNPGHRFGAWPDDELIYFEEQLRWIGNHNRLDGTIGDPDAFQQAAMSIETPNYWNWWSNLIGAVRAEMRTRSIQPPGGWAKYESPPID
jgi:hypothetical protein